VVYNLKDCEMKSKSLLVDMVAYGTYVA
ncbi:MAG: hypothetical protein QG565_1458, partial [Campylobacterota bacterium]|nr:hypothetical protein [Campylobacterota bacterium]